MAWIKAMQPTVARNWIVKGGNMYYTITANNGTVTAESDRVDIYQGSSSNFTISSVDVTGFTQLRIKGKCSTGGTRIQLQNNGAYSSGSEIPTVESTFTVSLSGLSGVINLVFATTSAGKTYSFYEIELV